MGDPRRSRTCEAYYMLPLKKNNIMKESVILFLALISLNCNSKLRSNTMSDNHTVLNPNTEVAIFAGGCFWCTEAVFLQLDGVKEIKPGYIGGNLENPTYEEVCTGKTGHAEAVRIIFDSTKIKYEDLLEVFFATHDPTTLNQQGADRGTQYRSEIFATNDAQKQIAQRYINQLNSNNTFGKRVVTVVSNAPTFYIAEDYHQNYYNRNKNESYCSYVIAPKVEKVKEKYKIMLKK